MYNKTFVAYRTARTIAIRLNYIEINWLQLAVL